MNEILVVVPNYASILITCFCPKYVQTGSKEGRKVIYNSFQISKGASHFRDSLGNQEAPIKLSRSSGKPLVSLLIQNYL